MQRIAFLTLLILAAGPVMAKPPATAETDNGKALVNGAGMSLYTFDKDAAGKSACTGTCASNWPPFLASPGDKAGDEFAPIVRPDGSKQWSAKGKPLYTWINDTRPGQTTGDGVKDVWHLARP